MEPTEFELEIDADEEYLIGLTLDEIGDLIHVAELGSVGLGNEPQVLVDLRGIFEELNGTSEA